jgi:uncharacterized protein
VSAAAVSLEALRAAERTPVPWRNSGGVTREVAVSPAGSSLDDFDWRVSVADIRAAGPFSRFPGIERQMAVLSGRLSFAIGERSPLILTAESQAVAFAGEASVSAEPLDGFVTDLNVMTRRARCSARLTRRTAQETASLEARSETLLLALSDLIVRHDDVELCLSRLDALRIARGARCTIAARTGPAAFHLIEIL